MRETTLLARKGTQYRHLHLASLFSRGTLVTVPKKGPQFVNVASRHFGEAPMSSPFIFVAWRDFRLVASGWFAVAAVIAGIAMVGRALALW